IELKDASAKLALHDGSLSIKRLSVHDLAGSAISVAGGIEDPWGQPRGSMLMVVSGHQLDGIIAATDRFFPRGAEVLKTVAPRLGRTELQVRLEIEPSGEGAEGSSLRMRVDGSAGGTEVSFRGSLIGDP